MRTATAAKILAPGLVGLVLVSSLAFGRSSSEPIEVRPSVTAYGADRGQLGLVRWAVGRFEIAGLGAPKVEVHFHRDSTGCGGHLGYAVGGRVDICTVLVNEMARRNILHEMSHIWIDQNVSEPTRQRFLNLRDLRSWNASTDQWGDRGYEQGAEILAWMLGNRILTAQIPENGPAQLVAACELLTGDPLPFTG